ncbi:MAG: MFS transporter [Bacteroidales bacterium]|nr:MFS transporter [Bacteroidales bacterium]
MLKPIDTLDKRQIQKGLNGVIRDGVASQIMVTLTSGTFLVAFALKLGASNLVIGLLAAIPPLVQIIQLPSIYLVERIKNRRLITTLGALVSRIFLLLIALIPFLFKEEAGKVVLFISLLLSSAFAAVATCSWNSWMRDVIPQENMGKFMGRKMRIAMLTGIFFSLAGGYFIDYWDKWFPEHNLAGFSLLFAAGFIAGEMGVYFISNIPEPKLQSSNLKVFQIIFEPFKNENFRNLVKFTGVWSFTMNLVAPFFTVYLLKMLKYDMSFVIILSVISQVFNFFFLKIWGTLSDKFSNKSVLAVSSLIYIVCVLAWTFTTVPDPHRFTIPLIIIIHVFMGIAISGVTLGQGNIGLKLAPKGQATAFLAANTFIVSLAAGIAPILGGTFADFFEVRSLSWDFTWTGPHGDFILPTLSLQRWDFFFFIAFLTGLIALQRLTYVKEKGEVEEKVMLQELLSEVRMRMRNFSTLGGMFTLFNFPFALVNQAKTIKDVIVQGKRVKAKNYKKPDKNS